MKRSRRDLMKRLTSPESVAVALLAMFVVLVPGAYAEEEPVASDEAGIVTIETDTVQQRDQYVRANFWTYTGDGRIPIIALIDGCEKNSGRISYTVLGSQELDSATGVSLWTIVGDRLIDKMAASACQHSKSG
jgi:hypothetical protein